MKKLYRSNKNKKILGVCGGLAKYLGIDATLIRLIWIIVVIVPFVGFFMGIFAYIICGVIIPKEPDFIEAEIKEIDDD